jgi:hypothetical protein
LHPVEQPWLELRLFPSLFSHGYIAFFNCQMKGQCDVTLYSGILSKNGTPLTPQTVCASFLFISLFLILCACSANVSIDHDLPHSCPTCRPWTMEKCKSEGFSNRHSASFQRYSLQYGN